ncbi:TolB protein [Prosthecobacter fusiformis]|uniref:TolB protein n=1 Tax=Prosthecobacter fusiformis TaxID=48464 RepID=A0A4R7S663_9BACT|nr:PD40 domain-containing protein [Prosthecobacter fusiformis]TDU73156.1 TolB protein [Prosthecobacter fusiformis]
MTGPRILIIVLLLFLQPTVYAVTWPSWLSTSRGKKQVVSLPQRKLQLGDFTGGTGASAKKTLGAELTSSREFQLTEEGAEYAVSGSSVGGRVTGRLTRADGKLVFERTYAAPGLDENLSALADDIIFAATGKPGLSTSRLVFVSDRSGTKQIYRCDVQGKEIQQITHHPYGAVSPSLSPDGGAIAYTAYQAGFPIVQVLDLGLGWERTVTDTAGTSFGASFSPDGQRLALVMSFLGNPEIFVTDLGTNTAGCISDTLGAPSSPSWHPDGKQIIFADDRGRGPRLYVAEVPEKEKTEAKLFLWRAGPSFCTDPEFSPDGRMVAFTAGRGEDAAVIIKDYPQGKSQVIQSGGAQHPSWSPNGRYLCYTQHDTLYVHDLHTSQRRAVLTRYGAISEPRWMR